MIIYGVFCEFYLQLYIVKEQSELDFVVHQPKEKIEYYESSYGTHNTAQLFVIALLELKNEVRTTLDVFCKFVVRFRLAFVISSQSWPWVGVHI